MPECVGRVKHVASSTEFSRQGGSAEEIPHQCFARRDEAVRQHPPGAGGQPPRAQLRRDRFPPFRPHCEVVSEQRHLTVEQKGWGRPLVRCIEPAVERRHQTRHQPGAREVPLAVPVGVRNQVECAWLHALSGRRTQSHVFTNRNDLPRVVGVPM